jgi:hypothetical protein
LPTLDLGGGQAVSVSNGSERLKCSCARLRRARSGAAAALDRRHCRRRRIGEAAGGDVTVHLSEAPADVTVGYGARR